MTSAGPGHRQRGGGLPQYYTIEAVAESLDVSTRSIRRWIADGALAAHRFGGALRISEADLKAFLAEHREG
jgi:excisionase family DNA binding protein